MRNTRKGLQRIEAEICEAKGKLLHSILFSMPFCLSSSFSLEWQQQARKAHLIGTTVLVIVTPCRARRMSHVFRGRRRPWSKPYLCVWSRRHWNYKGYHKYANGIDPFCTSDWPGLPLGWKDVTGL